MQVNYYVNYTGRYFLIKSTTCIKYLLRRNVHRVLIESVPSDDASTPHDKDNVANTSSTTTCF